MRRLPWMASALAVALFAPASALAASIELVTTATGKEVRYVAGPGEFNAVYPQLWEGKVLVQDGLNYGVIPFTATPPCAEEPYVPAMSPTLSCPATDVESLYIDMGDQSDDVTVGGMGALPWRVTIDAGAGNDTIFTLDERVSTIDCGPGEDVLTADPTDVAVNCEVRRASPPGTDHPSPPAEPGWTRADGRPIGVSINGGATYTNTPDVMITALGPDGANILVLSNDGGFGGAHSFPTASFAPLSPWTLDATAPERIPRTVYARFNGSGIDGTRTFSDDIVLDRTAPKVIAARAVRGKLRVRAWDATSGVARMQLRYRGGRTSGFGSFASGKRVSRTATAVRVRDGAMNMSRWRAVSR